MGHDQRPDQCRGVRRGALQCRHDDATVSPIKKATVGLAGQYHDMPAFDREPMIATFPGPRAAWSKDTEGNLIGLVQLSD